MCDVGQCIGLHDIIRQPRQIYTIGSSTLLEPSVHHGGIEKRPMKAWAPATRLNPIVDLSRNGGYDRV